MRVRFSSPAHENRYWWTILECDGRYVVCVRERLALPDGLLEYETQIPEKVKPVKTVGLDYASHGLYVSSDGEHAEYPGYYRKTQDKLAREQCKLSHMVKGSANWRKQCKRSPDCMRRPPIKDATTSIRKPTGLSHHTIWSAWRL